MIFHSSLENIQAITFDLDDTLYDNSGVIDRAETWFKSFLRNNHDLSKGNIYGSYDKFKSQLIAQYPTIEADVTRCRREALFAMFKSIGNDNELASYNADCAIKAFVAVRSSLQVPTSCFSVLRSLARRYYVGAITNGNVDVERIGLSSFFSFVIRANEQLKAKPSPVIFKTAAAFWNLPIENILHVGDDVYTDVYGSKRAGMKSCLLKTKRIQDNFNVKPDVEVNNLEELRILLNV